MIHQPFDTGQSLIILVHLLWQPQRILPMVQQIYVGITSILGNSAALDEVINLLNLPIKSKINFKKILILNLKMLLNLEMCHSNIKAEIKSVLENLNYKIPKGESYWYNW